MFAGGNRIQHRSEDATMIGVTKRILFFDKLSVFAKLGYTFASGKYICLPEAIEYNIVARTLR